MCSVNNVVGRLRLARGNAGGFATPVQLDQQLLIVWIGFRMAILMPVIYPEPPCIVEPYERLFIPKLEISCGPRLVLR